MSSLWGDTIGLIHNGTTFVACDTCPCDSVSSSSGVPCDCWGINGTGSDDTCTDIFDNPVDPFWTASLSGYPEHICAGDSFTLTGTFTNSPSDDCEVSGQFTIGFELDGAVLDITSHTGDTSTGDGTESISASKTVPFTVAGGASVSISISVTVTSVSAALPSPANRAFFGGQGLDRTGYGLNNEFGRTAGYTFNDC